MEVTDVYDRFLEKRPSTSERPGQREAVRVLVELSGEKMGTNYAIQAPTGTGKSYAALLCGVHNAFLGRRTVIGTSTLVLSDQYASDMAIVQGVFPGVRFEVLKGASNYYCGVRAESAMRGKDGARQDKMMASLIAFRRGTSDWLPQWAQADAEHCSGCSDKYKRTGKTSCEYARARRAALDADVVVTTHAMMNLDLRMRPRSGSGRSGESRSPNILGDVHLFIFDEAHKAADNLVYSESFGSGAMRALDFGGVLAGIDAARRGKFVMALDDMAGRYGEWVNPSPLLAVEMLSFWPSVSDLRAMDARVELALESEKPRLRRNVEFLRKAQEILQGLEREDGPGEAAFWMDRGGSWRIQEMTPGLEVIRTISSLRVAWMSATIGTKEKPLYTLGKCGLTGVQLFRLDSPFDYAKQLSWTVRTDSMAPREEVLVSAVNGFVPGGCVVLTPWHKRKERIADKLSLVVPGLVQTQSGAGSGSAGVNRGVMERHCADADGGGSPVLVGVDIFSTGVDLPGRRLTKLVVAGLFPLREDPAYVSWRSRWLEAYGGRRFESYLLPERAIVLEQQVGRIIRRVDDSGLVVFYVEDKEWLDGSEGQRVILEAMKSFEGAAYV